ncbi:MAG TPA: hypothetical protein VF471_15020 [Pseudoxanthomonas sp.]
MSPFKLMHLGFALLATVTIVCACTAPSDESKVQEEQAGIQAVAPEAVIGTDVGIVAPTTDVTASGQAEPVQVDAPAVAGSSAADESDDAIVDQQIESLLGNAKPYRDVFDRLQQAVKADDRKTVAGLVDYPLVIKEKGRPKKAVHNADAFVAQWDSIMTADIRKAVLDQKYASLSVNQNGAMLGSGQVWINGICQDSACGKSSVRISAINQGAP